MTAAAHHRGWACALLAIVTGASLCGCGRSSGPARHAVTGAVTYAGKPLAAGRISFEPDTDRGNKGPAGVGEIVAGRYETYRTMGVVGGPHRVIIEGYSGATPDAWRKRSPLFPPHITVADLPMETTSIDFDVPASVPAGRKRKDK